MLTAIKSVYVFDGQETLENHAVIVEDETIKDIVPQASISKSIENLIVLSSSYLVPGFIDLQVNGGGGKMFNSEPKINAIATMAAAHRKYGTTGIFPTLITDDFNVMEQAIQAIDQAISANVPGILGIHLEGPFLSQSKKGAHDADKFRKLDEEGFELLCSLQQGRTIVTIAPELTDPEYIRRLCKQNVIVCAGHSGANYQQTINGIHAGVTGFTHLYNAMNGLQSREPGMVGAALSDEDTWFGIIADGFHMHPSAFKVAIRAKQKGGAVLVTDAMSTVGATNNSFELNGEIIYSRNGRCENAAGSLAGSDLDMNSAVKNAIKFANITWQEAVQMASLNPAKAIGLDHCLGRILPGYKASLVQMDTNFDVVSTWINGKHFL